MQIRPTERETDESEQQIQRHFHLPCSYRSACYRYVTMLQMSATPGEHTTYSKGDKLNLTTTTYRATRLISVRANYNTP